MQNLRFFLWYFYKLGPKIRWKSNRCVRVCMCVDGQTVETMDRGKTVQRTNEKSHWNVEQNCQKLGMQSYLLN